MLTVLTICENNALKEQVKSLTALPTNRCRVIYSDSIPEAMEAVNILSPDIILSEFKFGVDLNKNLNRDSTTLPIIIISEKYNQQEELLSYKQLNVDNYLYNLEQKGELLLILIAKLLRDKDSIINLVQRGMQCQLTNCLRRENFISTLKHQIEMNARTGESACISIIDIDFFKKINDEHGHIVGDKVLKEFSRTVKNSLRRTDLLFRYGGEEFGIIFPNSKLAQAQEALERCLATMNNSTMQTLKVVFSGGILEIDSSGNSDQIERYLVKTDNLLYKAKNEGRNKIIGCNEPLGDE